MLQDGREKKTGKKKESHVFRMDFIQEIVSSHKCEDGSVILEVQLKPNPKRYEVIEINGETAFKDKFTNKVIPESVLAKACEKMRHAVPVFYSPAKQLDYCSYLKERKAELLGNWDKKYLLPRRQRPFDEFLDEFNGKETRVVILYVDMEGSTRISANTDPETNLKIIKIFLMQVAKIIDNFGGYVLKFVGDCAIGIFPADSDFADKCDNSIQAAMIMRSLIEDVINPLFSEKGLPEIGYHIGLDIGHVRVDNVGALDIAAFCDLIGYPMNLTAKIQSHAGQNEILLGKNLFELLHCDWQAHCEKADLGKTWTMKDPLDGSIYDVYRFLARWACKCWDR